MRKFTLTLILVFLFSEGSHSQSCLPEGITFTTQAQIDSFQVDYPGCTEIEGDLQIGDGSQYYSINNLMGLSSLTSVGGHLYIWWNQDLHNLTGLNNLNYVGGDFQVVINDSLTSLTGLEGLTYIGGDLVFEYNDVLTNLNGLNNLASIGGDLSFSYTYALVDFSGLNRLTSLGGNLNVYMNAALTSFEGLEGLTSLPGVLDIEYNDALTSLSGLENITSIGIFLKIYSNNALASLQALSNLTSVTGNFILEDNNALQSLAGLGNLTSIGYDLIIDDNTSLSSLEGLAGLTNVDGNLEIAGNESLTSLSGLDNINPGSISNLTIFYNDLLSVCDVESICNYLAAPNGIIMIMNNAPGCASVVDVGFACGNPLPCLPYGNYYLCRQSDIDNFKDVFPDCHVLEGDMFIMGDSINDLGGLNMLTTITGGLDIRNNIMLNTLAGLDSLGYIEDSLLIFSNTSLIDLNGLGSLSETGGLMIIGNGITSLAGIENLNSIGGLLSIGWNTDLADLNGLSGLDSVGGQLEIIDNIELTSLEAMSGLTSISGGLMIDNNLSLTSLTGLENIDAGTISDLFITSNDMLSSCEVESICSYLASPNGTVIIQDNFPGCNSQEEVEAACGVGIEESLAGSRKSSVNIYPNPANGMICIDIPGNNSGFRVPDSGFQISIFDYQGREVIHDQSAAPMAGIDVSALSAGMYLVKVIIEDEVRVGKFVKK